MAGKDEAERHRGVSRQRRQTAVTRTMGSGFRRAAATAALAIITVAAFVPAAAQKHPADLQSLPPVPTNYTPPKTAWGDYDFRLTWQYEYPNNARILLQRPKEYGNRVWLNDAEYARRLAAAEKPDASFSAEG